MYIIGKTGTGKSTLIEVLIRQDIAAGRGCALIDPHGDLAERVNSFAQAVAAERTTYFDAADMAQPYGYNPLRRVRDDKIPLAAAGFIDTLKKLWPDAWGVRMEHVLRNSLYALFEQDRASLPDILRLYTDEAFRTTLAKTLRNPMVKQFWMAEFKGYSDRLKAEAVAPIQNKLGALLTDPRLHRIFVAPSIDIRFRSIMDSRGVLIANLAKGRLGEEASNVLGGLIASTIGLAALSRSEDMRPRRTFFLYVDEFQSFTTLAFVNMTAELRKYGLGLILAHQHLQQLDHSTRHAVLGNAGSLVCFRVGAQDADIAAREMGLPIANDLISLPNYALCLRLLIDSQPAPTFSATLLRPKELLSVQ